MTAIRLLGASLRRRPAIGLMIACLLVLTSCEEKYPFLRSVPNEDMIPGSYVCVDDAEKNLWLREHGYTDLSARVMLHKDKTFEIQRMPHFWLDVSNPPGYDTCSGVWQVYKSYQGIYQISLDIRSFSNDSPFIKSRAYELFKKDGAYVYYAHAEIVGLGKQQKSYGLAFGVNNGDEGNIILVRE